MHAKHTSYAGRPTTPVTYPKECCRLLTCCKRLSRYESGLLLDTLCLRFFFYGIGSMAEAIRIRLFCCDNGVSTSANERSQVS